MNVFEVSMFHLTTALLLTTLQPAQGFTPSVWGLEVPASDVPGSERVWRDAFGFRVLHSGGECSRLEKDGLVLVLVRSDDPPAPDDAAGIHLNLVTADIARAVERAREAGARIPEPVPVPIPIGRAVAAFDPAGNRVNLIELEGREAGPAEPALFNVGVDLEREADRGFFERLGFRVLTEAYLPEVLPLARAGASELVIHRRASRPSARGTRASALLLAVERLEPALAALAEEGIECGAPRPSLQGRRAALAAPSGVKLELLERTSAQLAFERLCALAGSWEGKSSQGWTSRSEIEVIARGTVVLERTNFEAHPGETMLTLFHMDGERLLLTHYCVAGNQPRLAASEIAEDRLHFTFVDATNMPSRDSGHMDEAVFRLEGPDAFSSLWSFYRDGQTSWMEEIRYRRLAAAESR